MDENMKNSLKSLGIWDVNDKADFGGSGTRPREAGGTDGVDPVDDAVPGQAVPIVPGGPDVPDGPDGPDMTDGDDDGARVMPVELLDVLGRSYLNYAMSVIVARALPDVRDGLKPVHRRILYAMSRLGLMYNVPYKKCATTVGDVLGHYHPHGDSSVYDALVRMAQDFSLRYPLIDGHGNFGSMDGDPAAAYRYSEARLSRVAGEMLRDIDKDTVEWNDNFDNTLKEPSVLPGRFPNSLANGSQGIAVGMACNIPPHNLGEILDGCMMMLDNDAAGKETTVNDLLEVIHGPDFPTGGTILGESWREVYHTGKGRIELESVYHTEQDKKSKKTLLVFTEIPYQINKGGESKSSLMSEIVRYVKEKKLDVSDVRDESSREGVRVVVELKRTAIPDLVLNNLLQHTRLRTAFSAQMLFLVDGRPMLLPLDKILRHYLDHQMNVVRRRTVFEKDKAEKRRHVLDGLIIAVSNIDAVIDVIRTADDPAGELSSRFGLDDVQVQAVLDMRLRALQKLESDKLEADRDREVAEVARCDRLLSDGGAMREQLKSELSELGGRYRDGRRTGHKAFVGDFTADDLIEDEPCVLMRTDMGYVKRMKPDAFRLQKRGGRGSKVATASGDCVLDMVAATTLSRVLFFTDRGRAYCVRAYQIPDTARTARGVAMAGLLRKLRPDETVTGMAVMDVVRDAGGYLIIGTAKGVIKRIAVSMLPDNIRSSGLSLVNLDEGDSVRGTVVVSGTDSVMLVTRDGNCASYPASLVRAVGRNARGVRSMKLADGDEVAAVVKLGPGGAVLVTESGFAKRISAGDVPSYKSRSVGGAQCVKPSDRASVGRVACVLPVDGVVDVADLVVTCDSGQVIRVPLSSVPSYGRRAKGLRMIDLADGGIKVISAALTDRDEEDGGIKVISAALTDRDEEDGGEDLDAAQPSGED